MKPINPQRPSKGILPSKGLLTTKTIILLGAIFLWIGTNKEIE